MSNLTNDLVVANKGDLIAIADAIRAKAGTSDSLSFPDGFVEVINSILVQGEESSPWVITSGDGSKFGGETRELSLDAYTKLTCTPILSDTNEYKLTFQGVEYFATGTSYSTYTQVQFTGIPIDGNSTITANFPFQIYSDYIRIRLSKGTCTGTCKLESFKSA